MSEPYKSKDMLEIAANIALADILPDSYTTTEGSMGPDGKRRKIVWAVYNDKTKVLPRNEIIVTCTVGGVEHKASLLAIEFNTGRQFQPILNEIKGAIFKKVDRENDE